MKFFLFKKNIIVVKISIIFLILTTNSYGFSTIVKNVFSKNLNLLTLEKKLNEKNDTNILSPLESALLNDFTNNNQLKTLIIEEKNRITLTTIAYYLSALEHKQLSILYYNLNSEFLKLFQEYPKAKLLNYDKTTITKITNKLEQTNKRLLEQNKVHNQTLTAYKNYTGQKFSQTNLLSMINETTIPISYETAYKHYNLKDELSKKAISNILKIKNSKNIIPHIQKYYEDYFTLVTLYKNKIKRSKDPGIKKNLLIQLEQKEKIFFFKEELLKLKYKILFQKVKISFITGDLLDMSNHSLLKNRKEIRELKLRRVNFLPNATKLSSYSMNTLKENVKKLAKIENFIIELHGYSDSMGNKKINSKLTRKRLNNVKKDMIKLGIDKDKIVLHVKVDTKPIASNKTKNGRLLNRRIEFKVYEDNR